MYEAVIPRQCGSTTLARYAATAAKQGYSGVISRTGIAENGPDPAIIEERYDIDIADAIEVRTDDPSVLAGTVGAERAQRSVILVRGGSQRINRQAVENPRVDVLTTPFRAAGDVNHVIAEAAARNGVRIEVNLSPILTERGGTRVNTVANLRKLREVTEHANTPIVISARPTSHFQLRAPRELAAVGSRIGFDRKQMLEGLREWELIVKQNRKRLSEHMVERGVTTEQGEDKQK